MPYKSRGYDTNNLYNKLYKKQQFSNGYIIARLFEKI